MMTAAQGTGSLPSANAVGIQRFASSASHEKNYMSAHPAISATQQTNDVQSGIILESPELQLYCENPILRGLLVITKLLDKILIPHTI
jgi:hypothetical protein